jgi:hypothetical protein
MHSHVRLLYCLLIAFLSVTTFAQNVSLSLDAGSGAPGSTVSLPMHIATQGLQVAAVEWTLAYAPADFSGVSIQPGSSASSSGKAASCNTIAPGQYICVLYNLNSNTISDGVLANVLLTVSNSPSNSSSAVSILSPVAAAPDGSGISGVGSGSAVTIVGSPTLSGLTCTPATIVAPNSSSCTVTLSGAASNPLTISLGATTNSGVSVSMPSSITIPAGASQGSFTASVTAASSNATVQLSATLNGASTTLSLNVLVITVTVSPASVTLSALQQQQFTATVSNTSNTAVSWSLSPNVGSISSSGVYSAPLLILSRQTVTVTATSAADSTKTGTAQITLVPLLGL